MENINPNNLKVGDRIFLEDCVEYDNGGMGSDMAEILSIGEDGELRLKFDNPNIDDFYDNGAVGAEFYAKDYKVEN